MNRGMIAVLGIGCLIFGGVAVCMNLTEDHTSPEIVFPDQEIIYQEGDSYDSLLEGVTAVDDKDGDVTKSIVVEKVYIGEEGEDSVAVYVAKDKSNNIARSTRRIEISDSQSSEDTSAEQENPVKEPEESVEELVQEDTVSPESPQITLTQNSTTIDVGESIDRISFVSEITDDKDSQEDLWRNIQISGDELDVNVAGEYCLIYYVVDSDGNKSNEAELVITVQ